MTKNKKQNREQKKEKKTILEKKMRFVFFFQTSNLHLIKQKYKSFFINYFYYKTYYKNQNFFEIENRKKINK